MGQVSVYLNGVKQVVGTDVTCSNGSTVVFASDYAIGDVVEIIALTTFSPADTVPATGGTFSGNVTHNGNVIMATNKKVQQKGAFMQSSTHQALTLGG